jgi:hypothetical protein
MRLIFLSLFFFSHFLCNSQYLCMTINPGADGGTISISMTNNTANSILVTSVAVTINDDHPNVTVGLSGNRVAVVQNFTILTNQTLTVINNVPYNVNPSQSGNVNFTLVSPFAEIDGFETFPSIGLGCSPINATFGPLPITLSTFSATKHFDRSSKLDWTTSSEINSEYFGIERSRDGDTWETISQVVAAGNSREDKYYEYIDDKLPFSRSKDQIFYYRLRLTDQDGSFKYSDIKGVNFNRQTADGVIAVYPNPATQMVHIDVVGMDESQGETKLRIFDMYGRVMLDKAILGSGLEPVDVLQYPSGVYNISVTQGDKLHQKQFIKVE